MSAREFKRCFSSKWAKHRFSPVEYCWWSNKKKTGPISQLELSNHPVTCKSKTRKKPNRKQKPKKSTQKRRKIIRKTREQNDIKKKEKGKDYLKLPVLLGLWCLWHDHICYMEQVSRVESILFCHSKTTLFIRLKRKCSVVFVHIRMNASDQTHYVHTHYYFYWW